MTDPNFTPVGTLEHAVVDLTEMNVSHSPVAFPLSEAASPRRLVASVPQAPPASAARVARRRNTHEIVDLVDDNDSVEVMPRGLCIPSARRARKMFKTDPNESPIEVLEVKTAAPPRPELQVLEVFPDADVSAVQKLLHDLDGNVAAVMEFMSENKYAKVEGTASSKTGLNLAVDAEPQWMYDFTSADSFTPSIHYTSEVMGLLLSKFPLSRAGAQVCCLHFKHRYTMCHNFLFDLIKGKGDDDSQYSRVLAFNNRKPLLLDQKKSIEEAFPNCRSPTIKAPRKNKVFLISDAVLRNEVMYVDGKVQEWILAQKMRQDRALKKFVSQRNGTAVECACCFDSYPLDDMASCRNEGHLFCLQCLKSFAENLIFGSGNLGVDKRTKKLAIEMQCFHGDGCSSGFSREFLEKALPPKTLKKYDEVQFDVSIKLSGLQSSICSCPKCGYQADVPDGQKLFECPLATCRSTSCRDCGEAAHIPLRCDEVVKDKVMTEGRLAVEEAITAAKIRRCPSCKKGFIKESGCNKITCGCGNKCCYLCQASISGYEHFCRTPHCTHKDGCTKCPLFTNAEEDDLRAMRQAGFSAAEQVKLAHAGNGDVQIDVNGILNAK